MPNMGKEKNENNVLDFKSTFEDFLQEEKPEVSQEDAIRAYAGEGDFLKKKKNGNLSGSDDDTLEDEEHLKRLKKELLESLDRVNELAKKIFGEKGEKDKLKDIKVKNSVAGGKGSQIKSIEENEISNDGKTIAQNESTLNSSKEDIINQMREKVQDSKLIDEQERSREE